MPKYVKQEGTNRIFEDMGRGELRELNQEEIAAKSGDRNMLQNFGESAALASANLYEGAKQLMTGQENPDLAQGQKMAGAIMQEAPVSGLLGQVAPAALAGSIAPALGGGLGSVMATEGAIGAAAMPESPGMGAAIGAGTVGALGALPAAARGVQSLARGAGDLQIPVPGITNRMPRNMSERVVQNLDPEFIGPPQAAPRYNKGLMTAQEFDEMGVPLTQGQRMGLEAVGEAENNVAKEMNWVEKIRGQGDEARIAQRSAFTKLVKNEMGVTEDVALTPKVIGEVLTREGDNIGRIMADRGKGLMIPDTDLAAIQKVVDNADTTYKPALKKIYQDIKDDMARNGGELSPEAFNDIRARLRDMSAPGELAGKVRAADKVMDSLTDQLDRELSDIQRQELRLARYRYKLAMTASKGRAIGNDYQLNPTSFGSAWDKSIRMKMRGMDKVGKAADTFDFLSRQEAHAGNTLQRVFANAPNVIKQNAISGLAGAAGGAGVGGLFSGN